MKQAVDTDKPRQTDSRKRAQSFSLKTEHINPITADKELRQTREKVNERLYDIFAKYEEIPVEE